MNVKAFEEKACPFCGQVRLGGGDCDCDGAKLSHGAKGAIKVERSETKKDSAEVKE